MTTTCTMILGDCLEVMPTLSKCSVNLSFVDMPYAVPSNKYTAHPWDRPISLDRLHDQITRLLKPLHTVVFSSNARLAANIISAKPKWFRYDLVWSKSPATGFLNANRQPLRSHEWLLVCGGAKSSYNKQMTASSRNYRFKRRADRCSSYGRAGENLGQNDGKSHPKSIIETGRCDERGLHPTQKPVALLDWIIRTYSNVGDMVLDPTSGSGTTCVSAASCGRSSVGIERDECYFEAGVERVRKHIRDNLLDVKLEVRK